MTACRGGKIYLNLPTLLRVKGVGSVALICGPIREDLLFESLYFGAAEQCRCANDKQRLISYYLIHLFDLLSLWYSPTEVTRQRSCSLALTSAREKTSGFIRD